jgi:hypothetical protein
MIFDAGTGAAREIVMVFALAVAGLLLAMVAAFTPWYDGPADRQRPVVELWAPEGAPGAGSGTSGQVTAREAG